jgi:hypothetical protein
MPKLIRKDHATRMKGKRLNFAMAGDYMKADRAGRKMWRTGKRKNHAAYFRDKICKQRGNKLLMVNKGKGSCGKVSAKTLFKVRKMSMKFQRKANK